MNSQLTASKENYISDAVISECGKYRYTLDRRWDSTKGKATFIGLNPSTADATEDDPTIRRCINFAKSWGYGSLCMVNLFAFRATQPKDMKNAIDPVGIKNNYWLKIATRESDVVIAAWGTNGNYIDRDIEVKRLLAGDLYYLKLTKHGKPSHPLYLKSDLTPKQWVL